MYKFDEKRDNIIPITYKIQRKDRENIKNQKACVIWLTGLSGSGKSTIANELEYRLNKIKYHTYLLDGDNIRRISEVAKLFLDAGIIAITAFISPFKKDREKAREIIGEDFIEVFVDTPLEECIKRDPKGLYKKALNGEIKEFTGINSPYEKPTNPDIHIDTTNNDIVSSVDLIIKYLNEKGYINV